MDRLDQKLEYLQMNPEVSEFVNEPENRRYNSAIAGQSNSKFRLKNNLLISIVFFLFAHSVCLAQVDVLYTKSDSLKGIRILKFSVESVVFVDSIGLKKTLQPEEVVAFYASNHFYSSENVNLGNGNMKKMFLRQRIRGEVNLYSASFRSPYDDHEALNFFLKKNNTQTVDLLAANRGNLHFFLENSLDSMVDFLELEQNKKVFKRVNYSYGSLMTFVSYYNHFKNPEKYTATKYRMTEKGKSNFLMITISLAVLVTIFLTIT